MKDLKFPIIKETQFAPKVLSMDEYYKFVQSNLKEVSDKKAYARWKKMLAVNVAFTL